MRNIRFRLNLIFLLGLAVGGHFAWQAKLAYQAVSGYHAQLSESLVLHETAVEAFYSPDSSRVAPPLRQSLKSMLSPARREQISRLLQAFTARDIDATRKAAVALAHAEETFAVQTEATLGNARKTLESNSVLALATLLGGMLWLLLTVRAAVLAPINRLSRRMMDFLIDRYSFQFSRPEANELGDLQRTFNSLAQRVINTMDELKSLDQAKSEFVSIASHELRTPLTSIKGSLSLLNSGVMGSLDASSHRLVKIAEAETDRLIRLINDLLDLAKIESGHLPLACSWATWDDVTIKVAESLTGLALGADITINVESAPGLEVFMDRDRVQQILTNLISNAIKFSPQSGIVLVRTETLGTGQLRISVHDQGPGIAPDDQAVIFQKFRQGAAPETTIVKGTGLGLTIAKALVEEHGGRIGVESESGLGSTFWFSMPKWRNDEVASYEFNQATNPTPGDGATTTGKKSAA